MGKRGHVGGYLRDAFEVYVEAHFKKKAAEWAPLFELDGEQKPIGELIGSLRSCTDIMPGDLCDQLELPLGSRYSKGVRVVESQLKA